MTWRLGIAVMAGSAVLAVSPATVAGPGPAAAASPAVSTTTTATTTTAVTPTTVPPTTTTVLVPRPSPRVPLPVPDPLPAQPYADDPDEPIGRIAIPAIGLDAELGQGMTLTEIDRGPSHWPGTAMPGGLGNVVVAGHRSTWTQPFRHLDALQPGDEIRFTVGAREAVYLVTETLVVAPTDVWIADQARNRIVTLFACHPVGSAAQRIVVRGELVPPDVPAAAT